MNDYIDVRGRWPLLVRGLRVDELVGASRDVAITQAGHFLREEDHASPVRSEDLTRPRVERS